MTSSFGIKMEKFQWINPENHSIAVDDQKRPVVNENGDLIVLDNNTQKCIAVPNTDEVLEIFGFGYSQTSYLSPIGSQKDSTPERDMKPIVRIIADSEQLLWSMRTPCQKDIEATREMLALVASKRYQDMFNDHCTVKIRVWKRICQELMDKGFRIADSVNEGGIKCHQKWRNLEKSYRNYLISSSDPNSSAPKKPPPYFEALHEILKTRKKYANAVGYMHTVVVNGEDLCDPDASSVCGQLNYSAEDAAQLDDELDDMDGLNDDHCYVVVGAGPLQQHASKRMKIEPTSECSTTSGGSGGKHTPSRGGNRQKVHQQQQQQQQQQQRQQQHHHHRHNHLRQSPEVVGGPSQQQQQQQQQQGGGATLEKILETMVQVQKNAMVAYDRHNARLEKLIRDQTVQTKRMVDLMTRILKDAENDGNGSASDD